ncbi:glycosyltransferase [Nocardiopsis sp. N85]|uniref:glycosyltransferase n=1 Tax=Nocardiopsis sp. N85 TaxID=3029400 RepID=UPI00237F248D|nr:glycosyltransferase [Nocardiopsis sp. N85]MDE3719880.1 glycosyltransferase [Nocardiopsis sp. N85]
MASRSPLTSGLGVRLDRAVRLADEGHVLVGGDPIRSFRLTSRQVSGVIRWVSGAPTRDLDEAATADALVRAGLAHPRPIGVRPDLTVDVVVIDRGAAGGLIATLDRLERLHPGLEPIVVGATGPAARAARAHGARVLPGPVGGAAARALALTVSDADLVALIDAGQVPMPGWLEACVGHFADPGVAAVLPRVLVDRSVPAGAGATAVAAVAAARVVPDRGPDPAPVLPWGHTTPDRARPAGAALGDPLRPATSLVLRRDAVGELRPDPSLGVAAELELLWGLVDRGASVRYEPRARILARPLDDLGGYLRSCAEIGVRGAALARRRGARAAGPELSRIGAAALALLVAGRPLSALTCVAVGGGASVATLAAPPSRTAPAVGRSLVREAGVISSALRGAWWPPAVAAVAAGSAGIARDLGRGRRVRRGRVVAVAAVASALVVPHLTSWRTSRGTAPVDPLTWTALGIAGDAARGAGVWWGMVRSRTVAPLVPRVRVAGPIAGPLHEGPAAERVEGDSMSLVGPG